MAAPTQEDRVGGIQDNTAACKEELFPAWSRIEDGNSGHPPVEASHEEDLAKLIDSLKRNELGTVEKDKSGLPVRLIEQLVVSHHGKITARERIWRTWLFTVAEKCGKSPTALSAGDMLQDSTLMLLEPVRSLGRTHIRAFYEALFDAVGLHVLDPHRDHVMKILRPKSAPHKPRTPATQDHPYVMAYAAYLNLRPRNSKPQLEISTCRRFLDWIVQLPAIGCTDPAKVDFAKVTEWMVSEYSAFLLKRVEAGTLKAVSAQAYAVCLRNWFRYLFAEDLARLDLSRYMGTVVKRPSFRDTALSQDECIRLLDAVIRLSPDPLRDVAVFGGLMLGCGCRSCEVLSLTRKSLVAFEGRMWMTVRAKRRSRTIPLPSTAQHLLELYLLIAPDDEDQPLFPLGYKTLWEIYHRYREAAGIDRSVGGPHVLRHTFATLSASGTNLRWLQEYLGHSDLRSTRLYIHLDRTRTARQIERFPSLIAGGA